MRRRKIKKYSKSFIENALRMCKNHKNKAVARKLNIKYPTLMSWHAQKKKSKENKEFSQTVLKSKRKGYPAVVKREALNMCRKMTASEVSRKMHIAQPTLRKWILDEKKHFNNKQKTHSIYSKYTDEVKKQALEDYKHMSLLDVASKYNIPTATINYWNRQENKLKNVIEETKEQVNIKNEINTENEALSKRNAKLLKSVNDSFDKIEGLKTEKAILAKAMQVVLNMKGL